MKSCITITSSCGILFAVCLLPLLINETNGFVPTTTTTLNTLPITTTTTTTIDQISLLPHTQAVVSTSSVVRHRPLAAWSPFRKEAATETEPATNDNNNNNNNNNELTPGPLTAQNAVAAVVWVALVAYAFVWAPGELGSAADADLVQTLVAQPSPRPEQINELFFAVWNCFVIVPTVLGALTAPYAGTTRTTRQRLPATPFLWASGAFGYFALGPYFATRTSPTVTTEYYYNYTKSDLGWASRNVFERKIFAYLLTAIAVSIPFSSDLFVAGFDWSATAADFAKLFQESRFVSVAVVDICLMSVLASVLVSEDCRVRGWEDKSVPVSLATLLFPVIGPCVYLSARPSLED